MADRPILFNGPMVRAILDGRKTQTRRVLKPQPDHCRDTWHGDAVECWTDGRCALCDGPPYAIGQRLWVREAHYSTHRSPVDKNRIYYRADCDSVAEEMLSVRWAPSIHMPRWASRLTLTVTDVKVERLQEISDEDAEAEGAFSIHDWDCTFSPPDGHFHPDQPCKCGDSCIEPFKRLWNTIYGPDAWDANPWVIALTFTAEQRNIDDVTESAA